MTLADLTALAEKMGATVIPDDAGEDHEVIFCATSFERFTDALYRQGMAAGLDLAIIALQNDERRQ